MCPNCHSKQVVAVQGQYFCVSCGQKLGLVGATKLPVAAKKRPVGRPPRARLDTPLTDIHHHPQIKPVPVKSPAIGHTTTTHHSAPKQFADVRPPASHTAPAPPPQADAPAAPTKSLTTGLGASWRALVWPLGYALTLPLAVMTLLPVLITYNQWSWLVDWRSDWQTRQAGAVAGELVLSIVAVWLVAVLCCSAVTYAAARRHDHRGRPGWGALSMASAVWSRSTGTVALDKLLALLLIAGSGSIILYGARSSTLPVPVTMIASFIVAFAVGYLLLGTLIGGALALANTVLSKATAGQAWVFGWRGFWHHFELVAAWVGALICWAIMIGGGGYLIWWSSHQGWTNTTYWYLVAGVVAIVAWLFGLQVGVLAQTTYRRVVNEDHLASSSQLLLGHQPPAHRAWPPVLLLGLIVVGLITLQLVYVH